MFKSMFISILTGSTAGIFFELFANEIPHAALLSASLLHCFTILTSTLISTTGIHALLHGHIPFKWSLGIVILAYLFLNFKSLAMENLPMPVYIVCSNMKLLVSMVLDYFVFATPSISKGQIIGVIAVTFGCILITIESQSLSDGKEYDIEYNIPIGLLYVSLSVVAVSLLLPLSNLAVTNHPGSTFDELFFMQNFLSLPLFYPQLDKLFKSVSVLSVSTKVLSIPVSTRMAGAIVALKEYSQDMNFKPFCVLIDSILPSHGDDNVENIQELRVPLAVLFMLGTIALTPVHRKQISQVSIAAKNSVIGQLIVCAVKTVVLLALFVILHINSVDGGGVNSDVATFATVFSVEEVVPETTCESIILWVSSFLRLVVTFSHTCFASLQARMTPMIALGVFLQTAGSVGYIFASNKPSKSSATGKGSKKTVAARRDIKYSSSSDCRDNSDNSDVEEVKELNKAVPRVRGAYSSDTTMDMLSPANIDKLYHSSKHLDKLVTKRFSVEGNSSTYDEADVQIDHPPSLTDTEIVSNKELSGWKELIKKQSARKKKRELVSYKKEDIERCCSSSDISSPPTSSPSSPLKSSGNVLSFLNTSTEDTELVYRQRSPDERRERRRQLMRLRQKRGDPSSSSETAMPTRSSADRQKNNVRSQYEDSDSSSDS